MKKFICILISAVFLFGTVSVAALAGDTCAVTIDTCIDGEEPYTVNVSQDGYVYLYDPWEYGKAFAGWSAEPDGDIVLGSLSDIKEYAEGKDSVNLYAKWITPYLASDEIYCFSNSSYYFDVDKTDDAGAKYYMNDGDRNMMVKNLYKTYAVSPVSVVGSIVFAFYPEWDFRGSCYGMSATAALQHYGYIDMLKYGEDAESLIDVQPSEELISAINYYQYGAMVSFLCENVILKDSPLTAKKNLKNIVETVESGKIVMFTYYDDQLFVSSGHTVLLTGAYTDENGNHVLIIYDNRYPNDYRYDFDSRIIISPDYSDMQFISRGYYEEEVGAFNWTADFSAFETIDINGGGSTISWYKALINHIFYAIKRIFTIL